MTPLQPGQVVYVRMVVETTGAEAFLKDTTPMLCPCDRRGRPLTWVKYPIGEREAMLTQAELIELVSRRAR